MLDLFVELKTDFEGQVIRIQKYHHCHSDPHYFYAGFFRLIKF